MSEQVKVAANVVTDLDFMIEYLTSYRDAIRDDGHEVDMIHDEFNDLASRNELSLLGTLVLHAVNRHWRPRQQSKVWVAIVEYDEGPCAFLAATKAELGLQLALERARIYGLSEDAEREVERNDHDADAVATWFASQGWATTITEEEVEA